MRDRIRSNARLVRTLGSTLAAATLLLGPGALAARAGDTVATGTDDKEGAAAYAKRCQSCHGADAAADTPVGRAMKVPSLVGAQLDPAEVERVVRENDRHARIAKDLSAAELAAAARHLADLVGS